MTKLLFVKIMLLIIGQYAGVRLLLPSLLIAPVISVWFTSIWFRPRILRNVTRVDWSTKILGIPSKMPIYIVSFYFH